jgi:hypothetical protein
MSRAAYFADFKDKCFTGNQLEPVVKVKMVGGEECVCRHVIDLN